MVRFLAGYWAMIERSYAMSPTRAVLFLADGLLQRAEVDDAQALAVVYEHLVTVRAAAARLRLLGAVDRCDALLRYYGEIVGIGCTFTPLPDAGDVTTKTG